MLVSPLDYWLMSSRQPDLHLVTPRWICGSGKAPHLLGLVSAFLINKPFLFPNSDVLSFGPLKCWAHESWASNKWRAAARSWCPGADGPWVAAPCASWAPARAAVLGGSGGTPQWALVSLWHSTFGVKKHLWTSVSCLSVSCRVVLEWTAENPSSQSGCSVLRTRPFAFWEASIWRKEFFLSILAFSFSLSLSPKIFAFPSKKGRTAGNLPMLHLWANRLHLEGGKSPMCTANHQPGTSSFV